MPYLGGLSNGKPASQLYFTRMYYIFTSKVLVAASFPGGPLEEGSASAVCADGQADRVGSAPAVCAGGQADPEEESLVGW